MLVMAGRDDPVTEDPDEPFVLSIGAVLGDSDFASRAWGRAIMDLAQQVKALRAHVLSPLNVNVVYKVNGRLLPTDFTGVRTGRFSKKTSHLMVQAAVPDGDAEDRGSLLLDLLEDAIDEAEAFARNRGIASDLNGIRQIVADVRAEL